MPQILLLEDLKDEQTGHTYTAGTTVTLHPDSPVYKRLISDHSAENIIPLPEETPGYSQLMKGGITSLQLLLGNADSVQEIKGIGEKTADEIRNYIQQLKNKGE